MSSDSPAHRLVVTLQDAHEQIARVWPGRHASAASLRTYYDHAARLYEQVSESDPGHRNEARYMAQLERRTAQRYARQLIGSAANDTRAGAGVDNPPAPASSTIPLPAKEQQ